MASVLSGLASTLTSALSSLPPPDKIQDAERMQLLGVINQLQAALEPAQLPIQRFCFSVFSSRLDLSMSPVSLNSLLTHFWAALWHRRYPNSAGYGSL
jgi:hypothetical protein